MSIKTLINEAFKDAPIVGLGAAHFAGLTLSDWLLVLGLIYGVLRLWSISADLYWKYKDRINGKGQ